MSNKRPQPAETRTEYERFLDMAREVEVDESPGALDRAFDKVIRPRGKGADIPQSPKKG